MNADFVTAARQDRRHHLRVEHDAHGGNEERRRHLVAIEEVENPRHGRRRPVLADRQGHGKRIRSLQQFIVDIERKTDGNSRPVGLDLRRELPANPRRPDRLSNLLFCGIDRDRIRGGSGLLA